MNEIKKLITYLTALMAIIGAAVGFYTALPYDMGNIPFYLTVATGGIAAFIVFLNKLNKIIDDLEVDTSG